MNEATGQYLVWVPGEIKEGLPLYRDSLAFCFTDSGRIVCVYKESIDALYPVYERDITKPGERIEEFYFEQKAIEAVENTLGIGISASDLKWVYLFDPPGYVEKHGPIEGRKNDCFEKTFVLKSMISDKEAKEIIKEKNDIVVRGESWMRSPLLFPVSEIDHDMVKKEKEVDGIRLDYSLRFAPEYYDALVKGTVDSLPVRAWSGEHPDAIFPSTARTPGG